MFGFWPVAAAAIIAASAAVVVAVATLFSHTTPLLIGCKWTGFYYRCRRRRPRPRSWCWSLAKINTYIRRTIGITEWSLVHGPVLWQRGILNRGWPFCTIRQEIAMIFASYHQIN